MSEELGNEAREAFSASREERDRTLDALRNLESALAMASASADWLDEVRADLGSLERAMSGEKDELNRPDSLLPMIAADRPRRFGPRIRGLQEQYEDITRQVGSLLRELQQAPSLDFDATDIRHRAGALIRSIHSYRARQTDLVYEALRVDLGER
jgi:hypothetical protein